MVSDDSIIQRLHQRDEGALQEIRTVYGEDCRQMAYRILENREDADECVNDMLMDVWDSIPPQLPVSLKAYLLTLVRRRAIDCLRRERSQKRGTQFTQALDELAELLPSGELVEEAVEQRELMLAMQQFLNAQKPEVCRMFLQRYYLAESVQTIAKEHHMLENTVRVTLLRTRKRLRDYLEQEGLL